MATEPPSRRTVVASLFPGIFAMVMATGIIAIAADQQGIDWMALVLYVCAGVAYVVLAALLAARVVRYPALVLADATHHARGFAFLTTVAGTNVLAAASAIVHGWWGLTWVLWWVSLGLWVVLVYVTLIAIVIGQEKPGLATGINGTWFLLTVATESIAVVAALLLPRYDSDLLAFTALAAFTLGVVLYAIVMTLVFLRWTFQPLDPADAEPPAWIAAGAVAITVLAGSNVLLARDSSVRIARVAPFVEGVVVLAWATATFWFPLMIAIGVWRHVVRASPCAITRRTGRSSSRSGCTAQPRSACAPQSASRPSGWLPRLTLAIALVAWLTTAAGLVGAWASRVRSR